MYVLKEYNINAESIIQYYAMSMENKMSQLRRVICSERRHHEKQTSTP